MTLSRLKDPLFLTGLFLLLLNDLLLKYEFGNWFTGKLSDVCGLFVFPFFWSALFPSHSRKIHIGTAVLFIIWKSPMSNYFLELLNEIHLPVSRVVDYSDLFTLPIIFFSYHRFQQEKLYLLPISTTLISITSLFAFCATSTPRQPKLDYVNLDRHYIFPFPLKELGTRMNRDLVYHAEKMTRYSSYYFDSSCNCYLNKYGSDTLAQFLDLEKVQAYDTIPIVSFLAKMKIVGYGDSSALLLDEIHTWAPADTDTVKYKKNMLKTFNKLIVKRLRKD